MVVLPQGGDGFFLHLPSFFVLLGGCAVGDEVLPRSVKAVGLVDIAK